MGDALFELEQILRSKQGTFSSQEANVIMTRKAKALRYFTIGAGVGAAAAWFATRKFGNLFSINFAGGIAAVSGFWNFGRSLDSCIEQILCLDGSRMQKESANIMVKKYPNDPRVTMLVSKRFYCENVFDDSTSSKPKLRWRFRNYFVDNAVGTHITADVDSNDTANDSQPKSVPMGSGFVGKEDPFDCIFGLPARVKEIQRPTSSSTSTRRQSRKHRRAQHKHQSLTSKFQTLLFPMHKTRLIKLDKEPPF